MNEAFGKQLQEKLKTIQYTLLKVGKSTQDAEDILLETCFVTRIPKFFNKVNHQFPGYTQ
ncbi:hypothetical protein AEA09_09480 [Lysinibacillus contaminans]|uniref:Uncharacterized protein n=1 Tax=Lysinibacillus contaminans TaxID=1293441 RepID=A0ABR5K237_9BACI|nr:hypothetical protein [Lysinibacillus contaminans]KOS68745.1 hypothetical protein AEA09_09480 [Lysinibacillus contaminans]